ncbi:MAG: type II 3-dehydroquinate dehydratase [Solobacterium sp.]|nr:type II 3-dehydroquinate dehydratase [Solobacterium sp.]
MKLMILNGPNLNMVGIREKQIYGTETFADLIQMIRDAAKERNVEVDCRQSNHEGDLVDWIQEAYFKQYDGIVINPGAYTHTSIALADAVHAIEPLPVVEVHISDISERESFRHSSYEAPFCLAQIKGHGFAGYVEAMDLILSHGKESAEYSL